MLKKCIGYLFLIALLFVPLSISAGSLDSPAAPDDAGSAMYTLESIYNRLDAGTTGSKRSGDFVEPSSGPGSTGRTLDEVMGKAPVVDDTDGAVASKVTSGKTFWGLDSGAWGLQTGTLAMKTLSDSSTTVDAGVYTATDLVTVDSDLAASNIKSGVTVFGITGNSAVSKTGQTTSYTTGDDGDLEKGVSWPGSRFTPDVGGIGTVTDNLTGLIWLKDASCTDVLGGVTFVIEKLTWADALAWSNAMADGSCGLGDSSVAGDWRLPNWKELFSLIDAEYFYPALSDDAGTGKWGAGGTSSFSGMDSYKYWSSTTKSSSTGYAWIVLFYQGYGASRAKAGTNYVWPVRGGQ